MGEPCWVEGRRKGSVDILQDINGDWVVEDDGTCIMYDAIWLTLLMTVDDIPNRYKVTEISPEWVKVSIASPLGP